MHPISSLGAGVCALLVTVLLGACGGAGDATSGEDLFWAPITVSGDEVEGYPTLSEMAAAADLVARGRMAEYGFSREIRGDAAEDIVTYSVLSFSVTEVLRGDGPQAVPVEFLVNVPHDDVDATIDAQAENLPDGEFIVFLREKRGAGEAGLYRLVNSYGLWTTVDGAPTATAASDPDEAVARYTGELSGIDSLDELAGILTG